MYLFGKTRTVPMMAGPGVGTYYQLGYYRPNQAYDRSIIRGRTSLYRKADLRGLGDDTTTTTASSALLIGGLALGGYLLYRVMRKRSGYGSPRRQIARLAAQRAIAGKKLKELESE